MLHGFRKIQSPGKAFRNACRKFETACARQMQQKQLCWCMTCMETNVSPLNTLMNFSINSLFPFIESAWRSRILLEGNRSLLPGSILFGCSKCVSQVIMVLFVKVLHSLWRSRYLSPVFCMMPFHDGWQKKRYLPFWVCLVFWEFKCTPQHFDGLSRISTYGF